MGSALCRMPSKLVILVKQNVRSLYYVTARRYASAVYAVVLRPYVCLSEANDG